MVEQSHLASTEWVDIVNEENEVIAQASREQMRAERLRHRATYIVVHDGMGKILVQRRTDTKDFLPGMLDATAGGVVQADEVLLDMVEPDRIAALTYLADDAGISPAADKAVRVKGRVQSGSLESVLAQKPDLVLVPNWTDLNFVELLRGAGVNVYVYKTPTTVKEIKQTICELSNVVDERVAGGKIVAGMEKELAFVRARVGNIAPEEHISVMALSYMGPFGAKGTTFADICNYAEVKNVVAEYDLPPNAAFSEETLIRLNPDLLVIPSWKYDNEQDPSKMREEILQNRAYQSVNAVKNKRVVQLRDTYLYSTTHYIVYAIRDLAEAAYPEKFN